MVPTSNVRRSIILTPGGDSMSIMVTGGTGFIGNRIVRKLVDGNAHS